MGERQLDPIDAPLAREAGGGLVAVDDLAQLPGAQRPRLALEPWRGHGRGRHRRSPGRRAELLAPAVEQLHEQLRLVGVERVGEAPVAPGDLRQITPEGVRRQQACRVYGGRLDEDRRGPAGGARGVVGDQRIGRQVVVDERRLMRGRDDPIS